MSCTFDHELLSGYLDAELDEGRQTEVRAHLSECARCAQDLEEMDELRKRLGRSGDVNAPADLWARIADASGRRVVPPSRSPAALRRMGRWVAVAAAAAVVAVLVVPWLWSVARSSPVATDQPVAARFEPPPGIVLAKYVESVRAGDSQAGEFLEMHRGREVEPEEAADHVSFGPRIPAELPPGYRVERCYVLATASGNALQCDVVGDSQRMTIFQQPSEGPVLVDGLLEGCVDLCGVHCRSFMVQGITILNWSRDDCTMLVVCASGNGDTQAIISAVLDDERREQDTKQEVDR